MSRIIRWLLLALFLAVVGLWPAAVAPIGLIATGAAVTLAAVPGPVLLAVGYIAWLHHRPATA
jgi:hypothetical protein